MPDDDEATTTHRIGCALGSPTTLDQHRSHKDPIRANTITIHLMRFVIYQRRHGMPNTLDISAASHLEIFLSF